MSRKAIEDADREEVAEFIAARWQGTLVMSHGKSFYPHEEQGFLERREGKIVGLLTYHIEDGGLEILTLDSTLERSGIGSSLMLNAIEEARRQDCDKVWLTTTNDRLRPIGFYQRLGFRMMAINLGAVDAARKVKASIPECGERGIPIHDEIVMELPVEPYLDS